MVGTGFMFGFQQDEPTKQTKEEWNSPSENISHKATDYTFIKQPKNPNNNEPKSWRKSY